MPRACVGLEEIEESILIKYQEATNMKQEKRVVPTAGCM